MLRHFLLFILLTSFCSGQNFPAKPSNYITDEAGILTLDQQSKLNKKCKTFEDSTSNQIFVYITNSLNGQEMQPLCQEIFHNWKIGQKGKNNGALIAIFVDDHKFRIHTGYGLEGVLPDLLTKKIQDEEMKPLFKKSDYYGGIDKGVDQLIYYTQHEYKPEEKYSDADIGWLFFIVTYALHLIMLLVIVIKIRSAKPKLKKNKKPKSNIGILIAAIILFFLPCAGSIGLFLIMLSYINIRVPRSSGSYSTSSSDWSSSDSSSSSSSSDSDFGGGGGGDSGGGGSDSDW